MAFAPAPKPPTHLGYYRLLSPSAGVRVSPLCLGGMTFGEGWKAFMGECDKDTSFGILDAFYEAGGNFIDTANNYQGEDSEVWIGEWMAKRGNRDEMVLATKYTTCYPALDRPSPIKIRANFQGNHAKSLRLSVDASLKKLQTEYIDLLYLHWWDFSTGVEEVMRSLHQLVMSGKVLYVGVSDTPAWIVSKANAYARHHGLTPFCVYQGLWNASKRDFERDILPMCEAEGMGLVPWGALGQGQFRKADDQAGARQMRRPASENLAHIVEALDKIATQRNTRITSVALAYVRDKSAYVFPLVGCRTKDHLLSNIEALKIQLTPEEMAAIEDAAPFDHGFPLNMLFAPTNKGRPFTDLATGDGLLVQNAGWIDTPSKPQPPAPRKEGE